VDMGRPSSCDGSTAAEVPGGGSRRPELLLAVDPRLLSPSTVDLGWPSS
jgi:hypothetical protein